MKRIYLLILLLGAVFAASADVTVGADRTELYLDGLRGRRVALYTNQTGRLADSRATVDMLIDSGIDVRVLFSPEHGIRGTADAGEHVVSGRDASTGLPVVSLFGGKYRPAMRKALDGVDVVVTDIQDVGLRYYTYYITMLELMREAASAGKDFVVLDRPNPLGMMVDGPVLDMELASGVGKLPIPTVHGLTLGEMALMVVGEKWGGEKMAGLSLEVVPCGGYTHSTRYVLPVAPSPNLPDMQSIYLYPSLCYFEATPVSLGRGTDTPFQLYGHPKLRKTHPDFSFTPHPRPGAKNPPCSGVRCYGVDLRDVPADTLIARGLDLTYLIDAYRGMKRAGVEKFFTPFFEKLIGSRRIRPMIESGEEADAIRATWAGEVDDFKKLRRKYLLYPEE